MEDSPFWEANSHLLKVKKAKKVKGKVVPKHHAMKAYWGSGGITPHIL